MPSREGVLRDDGDGGTRGTGEAFHRDGELKVPMVIEPFEIVGKLKDWLIEGVDGKEKEEESNCVSDIMCQENQICSKNETNRSPSVSFKVTGYLVSDLSLVLFSSLALRLFTLLQCPAAQVAARYYRRTMLFYDT